MGLPSGSPVFNEIVDIFEERGDEIHVSILNCFFITRTSIHMQNSFWMLKENVLPLETLTEHCLNLDNIPAPITYTHPETVTPTPSIVTLAFPYYDTVTKKLYSAGTRFARQSSQETAVTVSLFDKESFTFKKTVIPQEYFIASAQTPSESIKQFVLLLRQWANLDSCYIPYVWGGTSFALTTNAPFYAATKEQAQYYALENDSLSPKTGFDCSGLVLRVAQLCGIPYFFKNTSTLAAYLMPLQKNETFSEGDLIWFNGHVMVISNIPQNMLIEARGYSAGYGKIHEHTLEKQFQGITTYEELQAAYENNRPLHLLAKDGTVSVIINGFKILKMISAWNVLARAPWNANS